jgi:hypothetical protein
MSKVAAIIDKPPASVFASIPTSPVATSSRPEVYHAFAELITSPDVIGIGANVWDLEVLRLACLEKVRRDGHDGAFVLNFLANVCAPWAKEFVTFWNEGLGFGWNLLVNDGEPCDLLSRILFRRRIPYIFAFFSIPARLPGFDCAIYEDYTICRFNPDAQPLTIAERTTWDIAAEELSRAKGPGYSITFDWEACRES